MALSANELRIGNYVYWNIPEKLNIPHVVVLIREYNINTIPISLGDGMNDFNPIPLTKEWLLRFGFKHTGSNDNGEIFAIPKSDIWIIEAEPYERPNEFHLDEYFDTKIYYVHQLQNLYFALTSEELTIK